MLRKLLHTFRDPDLVTSASSFTQDLRVILATRFSLLRTATFQFRADFRVLGGFCENKILPAGSGNPYFGRFPGCERFLATDGSGAPPNGCCRRRFAGQSPNIAHSRQRYRS